MRRFSTIVLLLCFGALAPVQGMSWRWCLLENKVVAASFGSPEAGERDEGQCCEKCGRDTPAEHGSDCCVDMDYQPESNLPAPAERLPSVDRLVAALTLMEWRGWLRPGGQEKFTAPLHIQEPIPIRGRQRLAVLSIWTV